MCHLSLQVMVTVVQQQVKDSAFDQHGRCSLEQPFKKPSRTCQGISVPSLFSTSVAFEVNMELSNYCFSNCPVVTHFISPLSVPRRWDPTMYATVPGELGTMLGTQRVRSENVGMVPKEPQLGGPGRGEAKAYLKAYFLD